MSTAMPSAHSVACRTWPVLITRPEPGASDTAARVAMLGRMPILAPLLRVEARPVALPRPETLAVVLATSGNAVDALPAGYRGITLMAVGNATARRAQAAGFTAIESADGDAVALAALVRRRVAPTQGTLLLAAGSGQGLTLAGTLRDAGYRIVRRAVYAAIPAAALPEDAAALLRDGQPHVALFFSAETARAYVRLVRRAGLGAALANCDAVAIGEPACMALKGLPWRCVRVAARPNQEEMLALLQ
jgi:uroporphyrinogen-III synthase